MNSQDSSAAKSSSGPSRVVLIGAVVAVVVAVGLYFWGLHQGRGELEAQKAGYEQRISGMQADVTKAQAALAAADNRVQFLLARGGVYRTAVDLDERNFGTANTHLQQAAAHLGNVSGSAGGLDAQKIAALRAELSKTNINVATDLEAQRGKVLRFGQRLDAMNPVAE